MNSVIEKSGTYKGFNYEIKALFWGWRCGYVDLPDRLKGYFSDRGNDNIYDLKVHGGITFNDDNRIGFDCNHYGDALDMSIMNDEFKNEYRERYDFEESPTVKDLNYVEKECKKLIDQLINLKTPYEKGFEAGKKAGLSWLPIESAPKDGTLVLLEKYGDIFTGYWENFTSYWQKQSGFEGSWNAASGETVHPKYWMPIIPAPEVSGE